jgi:hypothetical protein
MDDEAKGNDDAGEGALDSILKPARGTLLRMPTMSSPMATRRASIHLSDLHSKLTPLGMEHIASNVDKWCDHVLTIGPEKLALNLVDKAVPAGLGVSASTYASAIKVFRDMLFEGVEHTDAELREVIMSQSKSVQLAEAVQLDELDFPVLGAGSRVLSKYHGGKKWYKGEITKVWPNGTYVNE